MPIKDLEEHFIKLFVLYVEMTWLLQCNYRVSYSCAESYHGVQPSHPTTSPHSLAGSMFEVAIRAHSVSQNEHYLKLINIKTYKVQ